MITYKSICKHLQNLGGKTLRDENDDWSFCCFFNTIYGELKVTIHKSDFNKSGKPIAQKNLASIYCCFSDFDRVKGFLEKEYQCRVFTGKWNFHVSSDGYSSKIDRAESNWSTCLTNFEYKLKKILDPPKV
jgi:hypothetical protein